MTSISEGGVTMTSLSEPERPAQTGIVLAPLPLDLDGGGPFEGVVNLRVESALLRAPQNVEIEIDMPREMIAFDITRSVELPSGLRGFIDTSSHKLTVMLDAKKSAAVTDLSKIQISSAERKERAEQAKTNWNVSKTDLRATVAGNECHVYNVTKKSTGERIEACFATNLPRVDLTDMLPAKWVPLQWVDYLENAEMPLRVAEFDATGKRMFLAEVTRVRVQAIDAERLKVPTGYKIVAIPPPVTRGLPAMLGLPML